MRSLLQVPLTNAPARAPTRHHTAFPGVSLSSAGVSRQIALRFKIPEAPSPQPTLPLYDDALFVHFTAAATVQVPAGWTPASSLPSPSYVVSLRDNLNKSRCQFKKRKAAEARHRPNVPRP